MLEIKKNESSDKFELVVDGIAASEHEIELELHDLVPGKSLFTANIYDSRLKQKVIAHRFAELPNYLFVLILNFDGCCITGNVRKRIRIRPDDVHKAVAIGTVNTGHIVSFDFDFDLENWKHLWSVTEYVKECECIFNQKSPAGLMWGRRGYTAASGGFSFYTHKPDKENTIESEISKYIEAVCELLELTEASLMAKLRQESVVMHFDFPEEVRVPCEQYLLYFVDFLKGLGVEATADIQHEAGQVLFSVTPADKTEALDKIHTALKTYLELASSPISGQSDPEDEIAIQRLIANVDHLKSQLRLSHVMLRAQETTIQAQQITIANQHRMLSGRGVDRLHKERHTRAENQRRGRADRRASLTRPV